MIFNISSKKNSLCVCGDSQADGKESACNAIRSLGQEDPLEKGMATHSSILACKILQAEEPGRPQSMGLQTDMTEQLALSLVFYK